MSTAHALKTLREEYRRSIEPARALAVKALRLENEISCLVNEAYGLTPEEIALMWETAPPRMPIPGPGWKPPGGFSLDPTCLPDSAIMTAMIDPIPKRRWYRLTPDRVVIGLLVVECLLWLSERFQWFGFNDTRAGRC